MSAAPAARLDAITGLRFFAALHVVLFHYAARTLGATSAVAGHVVSFGFVGVSFFFVLSGFILAYSYAPRVSDGAVAPRPFYASRVARIYPLYLAALLVALPGFLIRTAQSPDPLWLQGARAVTTLTLTQTWLPWTGGYWNTPAWSLGVEAFFYLLFPLTFGWWMRRTDRQLVLTAILAWAMLSVPPLLFHLAFGHVEAYPEGHSVWMWHTFVTSFPPFHLPQFAIGIAAGLLFVRGALPPPRTRPWLLAAAGVAIALLMALPRALPYGLVNNGLLAPLFVAVIALLSCTRGPAARLLSWGPLLVLGEASYAVYILQQPFHEYAKGLAEALGLADPDASGWFTLAYVVALVAVSVVVYYWLEVPARRWVRARLGAGRATRRAGLS